jgi:hypothetical protein
MNAKCWLKGCAFLDHLHPTGVDPRRKLIHHVKYKMIATAMARSDTTEKTAVDPR